MLTRPVARALRLVKGGPRVQGFAQPSFPFRMLDNQSSLPLYAQVERLIRDMVADEKYQNGELLPDEITLARRWGTSRNTVRSAMGNLVTEGLLQRRSGVGTRVRPDRVSQGVAPWRSFNAEMQRRGVTVEQLSTHREMVEASAAVARALGIPRRRKVLYVERIRGWDGVPAVVFQSYLHPRLKLTLKDDYARPLSELFAEHTGAIPAKSVDEFSAILAGRELGGKLKVGAGAPLLLRRRIVYDNRDKPVEYAYLLYRPDRFAPTLTLQ